MRPAAGFHGRDAPLPACAWSVTAPVPVASDLPNPTTWTRDAVLANDSGRETLPTSRVRLYFPWEVERLLRSAGFEPDGLFGGLGDKPYEWRTSERMAWVATAT